MGFPDFYGAIPPLALFDPLARLLGATGDGILKYRYADAVRLAGHSCPTVAGAWLMTRRALEALYPDTLPVRGQIQVAMKGTQDQGTTGVTASIISLITGAAGPGGFKGLAGHHARHGLLEFDQAMAGETRFTRLDTGAQVEVAYQPQRVPPDPELTQAMARITSGEASAREQSHFASLWQARLRRLLIDHATDPELVPLIPS